MARLRGFGDARNSRARAARAGPRGGRSCGVWRSSRRSCSSPRVRLRRSPKPERGPATGPRAAASRPLRSIPARRPRSMRDRSAPEYSRAPKRPTAGSASAWRTRKSSPWRSTRSTRSAGASIPGSSLATRTTHHHRASPRTVPGSSTTDGAPPPSSTRERSGRASSRAWTEAQPGRPATPASPFRLSEPSSSICRTRPSCTLGPVSACSRVKTRAPPGETPTSRAEMFEPWRSIWKSRSRCTRGRIPACSRASTPAPPGLPFSSARTDPTSEPWRSTPRHPARSTRVSAGAHRVGPARCSRPPTAVRPGPTPASRRRKFERSPSIPRRRAPSTSGLSAAMCSRPPMVARAGRR